jgi:zinc transport system substrate-binding protein
MKKYLLFITILILSLSLFSAKFTVSIYPYYLVLNELKTEEDQLDLIIPEGKSPHTYSLIPSDVKNIYESDLLVVNGLNAEIFLDNLSNEKLDIFYAGEVVLHEHFENTKKTETEEHDQDTHNDEEIDEHDHSHDGVNPHVWINPVFMYKYIIPELTDKMIKVNPESEEEYIQNSKILISKLKDIDKDFRKNKLSGSVFTFHNSFPHYAEEYGIEIAGVVQSSPGKNPSPRELTELIAKAKEHNVKVIFIEPQMSDKAAKTIASNLNIEIAMIDPLGNPETTKTIYDYYNNINGIFLDALEVK